MTAPAARSEFYSAMAIAGLIVGLVGFSTTFFLPSFRGEFRAPIVVYVHGALAFAWLLLFVVQTQFIRLRQVRWHRTLGYVGALIAAGICLSGVAVGHWATVRDLAAGQGDGARGQFVNILIELIVFGGLVAAAVWRRRDREWHKRLLTLATISVLGPAWFRFRHLFPSVPNPLVTFSLLADAVLIVVVVHELRTQRRVHMAYLAVGALMVAVHLAELFLSQSGPWLGAARLLLGASGA